MIIAKNYSAANAIAAGTSSSILFGPIPITHIDQMSMYLQNCGAQIVRFRLFGSFDESREFGSDINHKHLMNDNLMVGANNVHMNTVVGVNSFNFLTILASASANISASDVSLTISGKAFV